MSRSPTPVSVHCLGIDQAIRLSRLSAQADRQGRQLETTQKALKRWTNAFASWRGRPAARLSTPHPRTNTRRPGYRNPPATAARSWLFGGNTVLRVAVVLLFRGLAFLLRYATIGGVVPIELCEDWLMGRAPVWCGGVRGNGLLLAAKTISQEIKFDCLAGAYVLKRLIIV